MLKNLKILKPAEIEEKVLKFWKENRIFEKSVAKKSARGDYAFYDGPPFASGLPHFGNILASIIKDVIPRYQTMRGFRVERKWGWDCHGLPVEYEIEKELKLKTKKEIEKFGVEKFNEACQKSVLRYSDDWKKIIPRIGRWVDMENDYKTMDPEYTESVWWVFQKLYEKGLIYEGYKSMHLCPRCETVLSNFEVAQGYKETNDVSVVVKFELVDEPNIFLLAWTTTPWTLPGNVALAVNPDIKYTKIKRSSFSFIPEGKSIDASNEYYWVANEIFKKEYNKETGKFKGVQVNPTDEIKKGEELIGKRYKPLFDYYQYESNLNRQQLISFKNGWKIYGADFVSDQEGTGIVHIAPAFGEDDLNLAQKENLPIIQHIGLDGKFKPEAKDFADLSAKPKENPQATDQKVIQWLKENNKLFSQEEIVHSYPFCWRCETPLLNYATSSWFVKTTAVKKDLIKNNQKINWVPEHIKNGRFGKWLEEIRDWAISRSRFWGAPLPVWKCEKCGQTKTLGSIEEIQRNALPQSKNEYFLLRHGEAESNLKKISSCWPEKNEYHLTLRGRQQIEKAAAKLKKEKIDLIISSDLLRTKETAAIVGNILSLQKISYDYRLREINVGDFNGRSPADYHYYFSSEKEKFIKATPNGETLKELRQRLFKFISETEKKEQGKKILLVGHEYPLWLLTAVMNGWTENQTILKKHQPNGDFIKNGEIQKTKFKTIPRDQTGELNLHRPHIDQIVFHCEQCHGLMKRIPEVFDCWFESGAMPFAQAHFPFAFAQNQKPIRQLADKNQKLEKLLDKIGFPAEFIAEGIDQTRGWFYTLLVLATALFNKPAYKNVIVNGIILAEDGQKMSKRLKNYPDPMTIISQYGADALRFYLLTTPVVAAEDLNFSEKGVKEIYQKIILRLWNVYNFYELYADKKIISNFQTSNLLDQWILARLYCLIDEVSRAMENYQLDGAARPVNDFINDLSTWFLRRSRRRFQKPENQKDFLTASQTLGYILLALSEIMAPFAPFFAEALFQSLKTANSVHLENWPQNDKKSLNKKLLAEMAEIRKLASLALAQRTTLNIKVRQPLASLKIKTDNLKLKNNVELLKILADEINVKKIIFDSQTEEEMKLDVIITPELKEEGLIREFVRLAQDLRQDALCRPQDKIILMLSTADEFKKILTKNENFLKKEINAVKIEFKISSKFDAELNTKINGNDVWLAVKKHKNTNKI